MSSVEAIRKFALDSEAIRNGFKYMEYEGITDEIHYDKLGNRKIDWGLVQLTDGNFITK